MGFVRTKLNIQLLGLACCTMVTIVSIRHSYFAIDLLKPYLNIVSQTTSIITSNKATNTHPNAHTASLPNITVATTFAEDISLSIVANFTALTSSNLRSMTTDFSQSVQSVTIDSTASQFPNTNVPRKIVFVMWTTYLGDNTWMGNVGTRTWIGSDNYTCEFTSNRAQLGEANYVIFHADASSRVKPPPYRLPNHRWVFFNIEPPSYFMNRPTNWSTKPWWSYEVFNFTSSYSRDDDMPQPYGRCDRRVGGMDDDDGHVSNVIKFKSKLVAWFVSHCKTLSNRESFVAELAQHGISIDIFGGCNDAGPWCTPNSNCENEIHRTYKFYLSLENSLCQDYITEKVFRPLRHKYPIVPIVMGLADYASILPPHSYIDVRWFPSAQSLARYLVYLDGNVTEYSKYFAWRRHYKCDYYSLNFDAWCDEGLRLYGVASEESSRFKQWRDAGACVTPEVYWRDVIPAPHSININFIGNFSET
jgi:hypothetical protein